MLYDAFNESVLPDRSNNNRSPRRRSHRSAIDSVLDKLESDQQAHEIEAICPDQNHHLTPQRLNPTELSTHPGPHSSDASLEAREESEILVLDSDDFITPIRSHGAPLDTITERTSTASFLSSCPGTGSRTASPTSSSFVPTSNGATNVSLSYPGCVIIGHHDQERLRGQRATKSIDEELFGFYRNSVNLFTIPESFHNVADNTADNFEDVCPSIASQAVDETPSKEKLTSAHPSPSIPEPAERMKRPPSTYVRDIYHKLTGLSGSPQSVSPSKIPIPSRLINSRAEENAAPQRKNYDSSHKIKALSNPKNKPSDYFGSDFQHGPDISTVTSPERHENPGLLNDALKFSGTKKSSSTHARGHPHVFDTPDNQELLLCQQCTPSKSHPALLEVSAAQLAFTEIESGLQPSVGNVDSLSTIIVRNRSIFDMRANERGLLIDHPESQSMSLVRRVPLPLRCRNSSEISSTPNLLECRQSSREGALDQFPQPPSPNIFVTPPPYLTTAQMETSQERIRSNQDSDCQTFYSMPNNEPSCSDVNHLYHISTTHGIGDEVIAENRFISTVNTDHRSTPVIEDDNDPSNSPRSASPKLSSTIHMPSPLRPRSRPLAKYVLFPESPTGSQIPVLRTLRSISSMMRPPSLMRRISRCDGLSSTAADGEILVSSGGPKGNEAESTLGQRHHRFLWYPRRPRGEKSRKESDDSTKPKVRFFGTILRRLHRPKPLKANSKLDVQSDSGQSQQGGPATQPSKQSHEDSTSQPSSGLPDLTALAGSHSTRTAVVQHDATVPKESRVSKKRPHRKVGPAKSYKASSSERLPRILRACFCQVTGAGMDGDERSADREEAPREVPCLSRATTRTVIE